MNKRQRKKLSDREMDNVYIFAGMTRLTARQNRIAMNVFGNMFTKHPPLVWSKYPETKGPGDLIFVKMPGRLSD